MTEGLSFFQDSLEAESKYYHRYESPETELYDKTPERYDKDDYMSDKNRVGDVLSRHYGHGHVSNEISSQSNSLDKNDEGLLKQDHDEFEMQMENASESMAEKHGNYQQETKKVEVVSSTNQSGEVNDDKFNDVAEELRKVGKDIKVFTSRLVAGLENSYLTSSRDEGEIKSMLSELRLVKQGLLPLLEYVESCGNSSGPVFEAKIGGTKSKRSVKCRTYFSKEQKVLLNRFWENCKYPTPKDNEDLAKHINRSKASIRHYFKNMRSRKKDKIIRIGNTYKNDTKKADQS